MKNIFLLIFLVDINNPLYSQFVMSKSTSDRIEGKLKKEILDKASLRCWYEFTQYCLNEGVKEQVVDTFTLDIGPKYSVYYDQNRIMRDSLDRAEGEKLRPRVKLIRQHMTKGEIDALRGQGGGNYRELLSKGETAVLYKDRKGQKATIIDGSITEMYKCMDEIPFQSWELKEDTMTILGYVSQKAETTFRGRRYVAWFAPDIPLQDGPWKLYGLPGLMLKVVVDDGLFIFQAIGLQKLDSFPITMNKDQYVTTDRKQIRKLAFKKNNKRHFLGTDGTFSMSFEADKRIFDELERE